MWKIVKEQDRDPDEENRQTAQQ